MIYYVTSQSQIPAEGDRYTTATVKQALQFLRANPLLGVDLETQGLHPITDQPLVLAFGNEHDQYVVDLQTVPMFQFQSWLESPRYLKVFHHGKFDYKFFFHKGIAIEGLRDTMLAFDVRFGGLQYQSGLDVVLKKILNIDLLKTERSTFIGHSGPLSTSQIIYAADDVKWSVPLYQVLERMVTDDQQLDVLRLEEASTMAFAEIEYNGMKWDRAPWMELYRENRKAHDEIMAQMDQIVFSDPLFSKLKGDGEKTLIKDTVQGDLFTPKEDLRRVAINWASWQQRLKVFHCIDPSMKDTSVEEVGARAYKHELLRLSMKASEYNKAVTSYGDKFMEHVDPDGFVRTNVKQLLQTGRISMSSPNMQQIPAKEMFGNKFRHCFLPPKKDWVFVSSDFSSQELCIIATGAGDPVWLGALERGEDLHSTAAEVVYGQEWVDAAEPGCAYMEARKKCKCEEHKRLRTNCKSINFGLAYGMGPSKLAEECSISPDEAKELMAKYFKAFPRIKKYLDRLGASGIALGHAKTFEPFGRKRRFKGWRSGMDIKNRADREILGPIERQSKNHPFQGTGGDQTKLALVYVRARIKELGWPVRIVMQVHDQVDTVCPKEIAEEWAVELTTCMERAALVSIPSGLLKAETSISERWEK